jgi:hypothetical protein
MSAPPRNNQEGLSRREEMSVSSAAMSGAPLGAAAVTGGVVALGDLGLHVIGGHISEAALSGSLALGVSVFFLVAAIGALMRARSGRAARWARNNPWRFAVLPGAAVAAITLVLSVLLGGGVVGGVWSGLWHGAAVFGLTGVAGAVSRGRRHTA